MKTGKKQLDPSKEPLSITQLILKREYLIYFLFLPTLVSIAAGVVGLSLSSEEIYLGTEESYGIELIFFGYISCFVFALLAIKILYSETFPYTIQRPRTIILSLGISYFIAYIIGILIVSSITEGLFSDHPSFDIIYYNVLSYTGSQLMGWLFGGFIINYVVLVQKIDYRGIRPQYISQKVKRPSVVRDLGKTQICSRCGKVLPERARFCDACAYPVSILQQEEVTFKRVSFREAVELLDSESYRRGSRMNIEFECVVKEPASSEQFSGPAPYRTIRVTDPARLISRTLHVWGDPGHRHNINLIESLKQGERILINGPRRPKDSPYYKDADQKDVFWIERWDGTISDTGTRLLKLEDISTMKVEETPISEKSPDMIETKTEFFAPETKTITPPFYCQLCSIKHPAGTPRMQCDACGRYLCVEAFANMSKVGRTSCPMCDGKLMSI